MLISTVNLEANGISTFIINSAKLLEQQGINVTILAPNHVKSNLIAELLVYKIHIKEIHGRMSSPIKYFFKLKSFLAQENFDVVHVNGNSTTMAVELFAAKLSRVKARIAHSHNTTTDHPIINKILRPLFEFSINTRLACNDAAGKWLFKNKNFTIIPNGINLSEYRFSSIKRTAVRNKLHIEKNEILLGHVGKFNYQKNQMYLIKVMNRLPDKYKLLLVGQGEELAKVKEKIYDFKLENRVILAGVTSDVTKYLCAMDIFLLPSRFEGQPFVLIEATANGLGCIVSDRVSPESDLAGNIEFLSIGDADQIKWEESIKKENLSDRERKSALYKNKLKDKGYSLIDNVDMLLKFYLKRNKDGKNN